MLRFHSVKIKNYKSIGSKDNEIIIEPQVTTIIGKNESGKTNVLEALSHIDLAKNMSKVFDQELVNRNAEDNVQVEFLITLKSVHGHELFLKEETYIHITPSQQEVTGGLFHYYKDKLQPAMSELYELVVQNPFNLSNPQLADFRKQISFLQENEKFDIEKVNEALKLIRSYQQRRNDKLEEIKKSLNTIIPMWDTLLENLPRVFYRNNDKQLKSKYTLDEIRKELENSAAASSSLLTEFLQLIDIKEEDFIKAATFSGGGSTSSLRSRIKRKVNEVINIDFNDFYQTEKVRMDIEFDSNSIRFLIGSNEGTELFLSERSNGLRWYLNTFIDARSQGILGDNILYLFDEPGMSLHVNAQKQLNNLFMDLTSKGNQVVFSTHSPFMLDIENSGYHRIRAVVKNVDGDTLIYKTAYDSRITIQDSKDTLAPILSAIGMTLEDSIGPSRSKLNIVTEGVSDYLYITTFAKLLEFDLSSFNIIPSLGATSIINLCSILHGWGCPFLALFDYDNEGVEKGAEVMKKEMNYNLGEEYLFIREVKEEELVKASYLEKTFEIEDLIGKDNLTEFLIDNNYTEDMIDKSKALLAKLYCDYLLENPQQINEEVKNNFNELLRRISKESKPQTKHRLFMHS